MQCGVDRQGPMNVTTFKSVLLDSGVVFKPQSLPSTRPVLPMSFSHRTFRSKPSLVTKLPSFEDEKLSLVLDHVWISLIQDCYQALHHPLVLYLHLPPPVDVSCDVSYLWADDYFEVRGNNFPPDKLGTNREGLESQMRGCGVITKWTFTMTPNDAVYEWYAHGYLPIGTRSCVDSAVQSAGGTGAGHCLGPG